MFTCKGPNSEHTLIKVKFAFLAKFRNSKEASVQGPSAKLSKGGRDKAYHFQGQVNEKSGHPAKHATQEELPC